jgi:hypothetical protein
MIEACLESNDPTSEEIESEVDNEEVPMEEAAVKPVRALRKRHDNRNLVVRCHKSRRKGPRAMVGPGRSWQPPAEGWPTVQEWHSTRDTIVRDKARTMLYEERRMDGLSGRNVGLNQNATLDKEPRLKTAATFGKHGDII